MGTQRLQTHSWETVNRSGGETLNVKVVGGYWLTEGGERHAVLNIKLVGGSVNRRGGGGGGGGGGGRC